MHDDPNEPVTLTTARTEFEAAILVETLKARGVEARFISYAGSLLSIYGPILNDPIRVVVRRSDVQAAKDALAAARQDSVDIAWDELDPGEPEDRLAGKRPWGVRKAMRPLTLLFLVAIFATLLITVLKALSRVFPGTPGP